MNRWTEMFNFGDSPSSPGHNLDIEDGVFWVLKARVNWDVEFPVDEHVGRDLMRWSSS